MPDHIEIVDVTPKNVETMPCCGIKDTNHEGHKRKTAWLKKHFDKGLKAKILLNNGKQQIGYIEYLPGRYAYRGVEADGYMFIHCLWTFYKKFQHQGNGKRLIQTSIDDAKNKDMDGVAVLPRKKSWLADSRVYLKCGFEIVDSCPPDYELLVRKFKSKDPNPKILKNAQSPNEGGLYLIRSGQCPHTIRFSEKIMAFAREHYQLEPQVIILESSQEA